MKSHFQFPVLTLLLLAAASSTFAQKTNAPTASTNAASKEKAPIVVTIPKSDFLVPTNQVDWQAGKKDPFYPKSTYPYTQGKVSVVNRTNPVPVVAVAKLVLNGISGTPEKPLAIISNSVFGPGESNEVILPGGKRLTVRCVEINLQDKTVVVLHSGQRETLSLKNP